MNDEFGCNFWWVVVDFFVVDLLLNYFGFMNIDIFFNVIRFVVN